MSNNAQDIMMQPDTQRQANPWTMKQIDISDLMIILHYEYISSIA